MKDDPHEIAEWLVQEYGQEQAQFEVLSGLMEAHKKGDFYAVSVWREVRGVLEALPADNYRRSA